MFYEVELTLFYTIHFFNNSITPKTTLEVYYRYVAYKIFYLTGRENISNDRSSVETIFAQNCGVEQFSFLKPFNQNIGMINVEILLYDFITKMLYSDTLHIFLSVRSIPHKYILYDIPH